MKVCTNKYESILHFVLIRFRWDYLPRETQSSGNSRERKNALKSESYPGFEEFIKKGVHTEYIKSVFPSESFPSWQTINTGLLYNVMAQKQPSVYMYLERRDS